MTTITVRLLEGRIVVEAKGRQYIRRRVPWGAMLRLLTYLAYCGRFARICSDDQAQAYTFTPVLLVGPQAVQHVGR